jgi:hypothetical protein
MSIAGNGPGAFARRCLTAGTRWINDWLLVRKLLGHMLAEVYQAVGDGQAEGEVGNDPGNALGITHEIAGGRTG